MCQTITAGKTLCEEIPLRKKATLEEMKAALSGEPTLEELNSLPVEKVWYQLGLWLGIEEWSLQRIKHTHVSDKLRAEDMFIEFYKSALGEKFEKFALSTHYYQKKQLLLIIFFINFILTR